MVTTQQLGNFLRYGSFKLASQVDPKVMGPIFKAELSRLSFYSWIDLLDLSKKNCYSLIFRYEPKQDPNAYLIGVIYAKTPRNHFDGVDVSSFMEIKHLYPDSKGELTNAIKHIVKEAGIEKVVSSSTGIRRNSPEFLDLL